MSCAYVLRHVHKFEDGSRDGKLIGVYSSRGSAESAIARLVTQAGFCDAPEGFVVDEYVIDEACWMSGFSDRLSENSQFQV